MLMRFIKNRLKEASTWRALVAIATAFGVSFNPAQTSAIVAGGLALMGLIGAFTPDAIAKGVPVASPSPAVPSPIEQKVVAVAEAMQEITKVMDKTPE